mmetsp:Transcript_22183/g.53219  ORF Transcript_22183/g.53219 Transcript_22183/m.53219 type:complete len:381 (-) Transcript_22183:442-1584(-)
MTLEVATTLVLDEVPLLLRLRVHRVAHVGLEVGVDDGDHLAAARRQVVLHPHRVREQVVVPRHVPLPHRVLDVEPEDIVGDVVLVELPVDLADVRLILVVPAALMVPEREHRGHELRSHQPRVLLLHPRGRVGRHQEHVDDPRLREPVGVLANVTRDNILDIDHGLGGVEPEEPAGLLLVVREHEGHRAVERLVRAVGGDVVLEDVEVVEAVRLVARGAGAAGVGQRELGRALGEPVDVGGARPRDVHRHRGRAVGLGVAVRLERLLPEPVGVLRDAVLERPVRALVAEGLEAEEVLGVDLDHLLAPDLEVRVEGEGREREHQLAVARLQPGLAVVQHEVGLDVPRGRVSDQHILHAVALLPRRRVLLVDRDPEHPRVEH